MALDLLTLATDTETPGAASPEAQQRPRLDELTSFLFGQKMQTDPGWTRLQNNLEALSDRKTEMEDPGELRANGAEFRHAAEALVARSL